VSLQHRVFADHSSNITISTGAIHLLYTNIILTTRTSPSLHYSHLSSFIGFYSPVLDLLLLFIFWFPNLFRHMIGLLGRVISSSQCLYLHRKNTTQKDEDKHPCLKQDSNPRSSVGAHKVRASDRAGNGSAFALIS
jgi:hypothetical protein